MNTESALFDTFHEANNAVRDLLANGFTRDEVSLISSNANKQYDPYFDNEGRYKAINQSVISTDLDAKEREMVGASVRRAPDGTVIEGLEGELTATEGAASGAGIGAAIGGIGGVLMGLGLLAIPGVGPALAAGALASGLIGAGVGAAAGGMTGALVNAGVPEDQVGYYAEGVKRGGHLVTVTTIESKVSLARDILNRNNPVSMQARTDAWRGEGWTGFDSNPPL